MLGGIPALLKGVIRRQTDGGTGSGACGQGPIPLALGRPRDPRLGTTTRHDAFRGRRGSPMRRKTPRWSVARRAPYVTGRGTPRKVSLACRVMARQRCGVPHQRLATLRSLSGANDVARMKSGEASPAVRPPRIACGLRGNERKARPAGRDGRSVGCLTS
jgi:hypothetical protein